MDSFHLNIYAISYTLQEVSLGITNNTELSLATAIILEKYDISIILLDTQGPCNLQFVVSLFLFHAHTLTRGHHLINMDTHGTDGHRTRKHNSIFIL